MSSIFRLAETSLEGTSNGEELADPLIEESGHSI